MDQSISSRHQPSTTSEFPVNRPSDEYDINAGTIIHDFGLQQVDAETLDYSNFAKWIPRYSLPARPCEYCASRQLECWYTYDGQTGCSACYALFRNCSFNSHHVAASQTLMDTLHVVQEDAVQNAGALTGAKALRSWDRTPLDRPSSQLDAHTGKRSTGTRFSREALKILKSWIEQHHEHPYPSEDDKDALAAQTNLSAAQIQNWFANTRRRNKQKASRGLSPGTRSPTWPTPSTAIDIPSGKKGVMQGGKTWDVMNPLERWKASPPENEPAAVDAIAQAIASSRLSSTESSLSRSRSRHKAASSGGSGSASVPIAPSIASLETGRSESHQSSESFSNQSLDSSRSQGSHQSAQSYGSGHRKSRRRRKRVALIASRSHDSSTSRPFQCTFCTDTFRTKYDWTRHEKSLHLNLEKWICAPLGAVITDSSGEHKLCVYCEQLDPTIEHLQSHSHDECEEKGLHARTFYRKDHLRQHLRLVHGCSMIQSMDSWKSETTYIQCRCGFCGQNFTSWTDRCDHIAQHFRAGYQMRDWRGCRGFDVDVSAFVTNAMPPFLIGNEARSAYPFSASDEASMRYRSGGGLTITADEIGNLPSRFDQTEPQMTTTELSEPVSHMIPSYDQPLWTTVAPSLTLPFSSPTVAREGGDASLSQARISTCWEILTVRLGQYLQVKLQRGEVPTDEMLQHEARSILYDSDDDWNQTAADNPEWLELFKKAHGMPSKALDTWVNWSEDLGGLGDLSFEALSFQDQLLAPTISADHGDDMVLPMSDFAMDMN